MKQLLFSLLTAYGPSGREGQVREVIQNIIAPHVDEVTTDVMGNLIATKKGPGKRIMLAAHMDQIGFVVTDIDEDGFLRVFQVGGIRRLNSIHRRVIFENGTTGLLASEVQDVNPGDLTLNTLFIDIGAKSKEEAQKAVRLGDVCVYSPDIVDMGERVAAPAMDNRAGCAVLIEALKRIAECPHELHFVFTAQEELGLRGAKTAAHQLKPDLGIALDLTPSGDTPKGIRNNATRLGGGAAVKVLDSSLICTPWVVEKMEQTAERAGIRYQREVLTAGGTDAGAIQQSRGGVASGVISIPCRYVHSATEIVDLNDMECCVRLLTELLGDETL